jgi:hypothetical protein
MLQYLLAILETLMSESPAGWVGSGFQREGE